MSIFDTFSEKTIQQLTELQKTRFFLNFTGYSDETFFPVLVVINRKTRTGIRIKGPNITLNGPHIVMSSFRQKKKTREMIHAIKTAAIHISHTADAYPFINRNEAPTSSTIE
jgi:hypothetical protein